jgi:hypothetical protein
MKAKCPKCFGKNPDCETCNDGFINVGIAEGAMYTRKCTSNECGFENGMRIVGEGLPPLSVDLGGPKTCIMCKEPTEWELVGMSGPGKDDDSDTDISDWLQTTLGDGD